MPAPDLDHWLASPALRVSQRRPSSASPERLWDAAKSVRLRDAALLGRLVRWRIPGLTAQIPFDQLFREPPFLVLAEGEGVLLSGLVGRIWTLRRDYPRLSDPDEFRAWSATGTARVLYANWVEPAQGEGAVLWSETRVEVFGTQGRLGLAAVRPLVRAFGPLVGIDGIDTAVRLAEGRPRAGGRRSVPTV